MAKHRNKKSLLRSVVFVSMMSSLALFFGHIASGKVLGPQQKSSPINVYYWNPTHNFGDMLNEDLLNYFKIKFNRVETSEAENIFVGSILGFGGYSKKLNTFGVGFICKPSKSCKFPKGINCHCLRGKKTKYEVEKITGKRISNCLLGDPGLLCSRFIPVKAQRKYDVGIICHSSDQNSPYLKNIKLKNKSYIFIDIHSSTKEVCHKINECKFILSSAMHGLIVADSYGIPNRRIILTDSKKPAQTRCNFKFDDYYSIYENVKVPCAIDLKYSSITDADVDEFYKSYNIPRRVIQDFCEKYIKLIKNHFKV